LAQNRKISAPFLFIFLIKTKIDLNWPILTLGKNQNHVKYYVKLSKIYAEITEVICPHQQVGFE
jgi:hypothetical protein